MAWRPEYVSITSSLLMAAGSRSIAAWISGWNIKYMATIANRTRIKKIKQMVINQNLDSLKDWQKKIIEGEISFK